MDGGHGPEVVQDRRPHRRRPVDDAVVFGTGLVKDEGVEGRIAVDDLHRQSCRLGHPAGVIECAPGRIVYLGRHRNLHHGFVGPRPGPDQTLIEHSMSAERHAWARASALPARRRSATASTSGRRPSMYSNSAMIPSGTATSSEPSGNGTGGPLRNPRSAARPATRNPERKPVRSAASASLATYRRPSIARTDLTVEFQPPCNGTADSVPRSHWASTLSTSRSSTIADAARGPAIAKRRTVVPEQRYAARPRATRTSTGGAQWPRQVGMIGGCAVGVPRSSGVLRS